MRTGYALLTAALFAGGLTTAALAQHDKGAAGGTTAHGTSAAAHNLTGEHSMSGTISKIDQSTGKVSLNTAVGMLELHFPPAAISDLKAGDTITVHLGYAKGDVAMGKEAGSSGMKAGGTAGKNP